MPNFKILPPTYILSPLNCFSKKRLFEELCLVVSPLTECTTKDLLQALNRRESEGSTICANHVGMPHALLKDLDSSIAVMTLLPEPISYHTIDSDYEGVDIAIAFFFSPKDNYDKSKEMLFQLYELFENKDLVKSLRRSWQDPNKLLQILHKIDDILDDRINPKAKPAVTEAEDGESEDGDAADLGMPHEMSDTALEDVAHVHQGEDQ